MAMNEAPALSDAAIRDLLLARSARTTTDGLLASVRLAVATTPQQRRASLGFRLRHGPAAVATGVAGLVLVIVVFGFASGRLDSGGAVATGSPPTASAAASSGPVAPTTPLGAVLSVDQLNGLLAADPAALNGHPLVIDGTIERRGSVCTTGPVPKCTPASAYLDGTARATIVEPLGAVGPGPWDVNGPALSGAFAAVLVNGETLEYEGQVMTSSADGAFLPSELPDPSAPAARTGFWLVDGWLAEFDVALPCASVAAPPSGPQYNGCGLLGSLSDGPSQQVSGTSLHVPSDGVQVQDRAYEQFAPDPQFVGGGTQPERATFLVNATFVGCPAGTFCAAFGYGSHWEIAARLDPPAISAPAPGPSSSQVPSPVPPATGPVLPLTVTQLNAFMAMNSQSPEGRQLVISGRIAANPLSLGPRTGQACRYSGGGWTCPPAYLVGSNPRLGVEPVGDIGPGPWDAIGGSDLNGSFAATINGFTLQYHGPVETTANGDAWLPGQLPSPAKPGVGQGYWLVQGWIASFALDPVCGVLLPPPYLGYSGPDYGCGPLTTLSDDADQANNVSLSDLPHTLRVQNGAYVKFAPDLTNGAGYVPEQATFLVQAISIPACGPTQDCFIPPGNYHWAIVARIDPWPVPDITPPAQP
jgi:hypothetical protein